MAVDSLPPRNSKRTEECEASILALLAAGNPRSIAAKASGISDETLRRWCNDDIAFDTACDEAHASAVRDSVAHVRLSGPDDWRAAAWYLEHCGGPDFRKIDRTELTAKDGADLFAQYRALPTADLDALIATQRAALAALDPEGDAG